MEVAMDEVRKASPARAPDSQTPGEGRRPERPDQRRTWDGQEELTSEKLAWIWTITPRKLH
jgi:hypothetical protein